MPPIKSLEELRRLKEAALQKRQIQAAEGKAHVVVGMGTCGIAAGARDTMRAILEVIEADDLSGIRVTQTGCLGLCEWEPIVEVSIGEAPKVRYGKVDPERARRIMRGHVVEGKVIDELLVPSR